MSYPEPRYLGDKGEINAVYRPASTEPELTAESGSRTSYLATGQGTHGQFGLYRLDMAAKASGPREHFHRSISESFFILSGTVALYNGERWIDATAGDFLYVPEGGVHAFGNESDAPASMLLLFTPGAPREDYFERVGQVAAMSEQERTEFFLRHDTFWL
jgi:quercetin dioxygenase-like cupin family protein